jgi:hypothetical protein
LCLLLEDVAGEVGHDRSEAGQLAGVVVEAEQRGQVDGEVDRAGAGCGCYRAGAALARGQGRVGAGEQVEEDVGAAGRCDACRCRAGRCRAGRCWVGRLGSGSGCGGRRLSSWRWPSGRGSRRRRWPCPRVGTVRSGWRCRRVGRVG